MTPPRPHPGTCACDACQAWARAVVAAPSPARKRAEPIAAPPPPELPPEEFFRQLIGIASKATGLSEAKLRARAEDMGIVWPQEGVGEQAPRQLRRHWLEEHEAKEEP